MEDSKSGKRGTSYLQGCTTSTDSTSRSLISRRIPNSSTGEMLTRGRAMNTRCVGQTGLLRRSETRKARQDRAERKPKRVAVIGDYWQDDWLPFPIQTFLSLCVCWTTTYNLQPTTTMYAKHHLDRHISPYIAIYCHILPSTRLVRLGEEGGSYTHLLVEREVG